MKEIKDNLLQDITGAGNPNQQLVHDFGTNVAWGAGLGGLTGGPAGAFIGGAGGAVQTVVQGAFNHGPVNVPIPRVPMGPTWNGSGPGGRVCRIQGGYQFSE